MRPPSLMKHIASSLSYLVFLSVILVLNNIGVNWLLHKITFPFFYWFYNISPWRQLLIILGSLIIIAGFLKKLFDRIAAAINMLISSVFLENIPTVVVSMTLCLTNFILCTFYMLPELKWNLGIVIMWLLVLGFVFQLNRIFLYRGKIYFLEN
jgi:hypothetical protein